MSETFQMNKDSTVTAETPRHALAEKATDYVRRTQGDIVSDLFGDFFAFHQRNSHRFLVARVNTKAKGKVTVYAKPFDKVDEAITEARERGKGEPVVTLQALPMQRVVDKFCQKTGMKASGDAFGDFVVVSAPVQDRQRQWRLAKRNGNELELLPDSFRDRWAADNVKRQKAGHNAPSEPLYGPHMFPYGNQFPRNKPTPTQAVTSDETLKKEPETA